MSRHLDYHEVTQLRSKIKTRELSLTISIVVMLASVGAMLAIWTLFGLQLIKV
jgi:hypothetical protein